MGQEGVERVSGFHGKGSTCGILVPATAELGGNVPYAVIARGAEAGLGEDLAVFLFFTKEKGHADSDQPAELFHKAFRVFAAASRGGKGGTGHKGYGESATFEQASLSHEAAPEAEFGFAPVIF